jgi:hypothetical protein
MNYWRTWRAIFILALSGVSALMYKKDNGLLAKASNIEVQKKMQQLANHFNELIAGVYLMGKLFEDQADNAATLTYRINGP